ncbi:MAG: hypothetical protein JWM10_4796, partial [Myxococcaceae bacterium]|nr:hypothetical protein [Myxococcaceae bacterium]
VGVLAGALLLGGAWFTLERAREKSDPRRAVVRTIRREAGPRDLLVVTDEAPELVAMAAPVPALWGLPTMDDLPGVRRVYGVAPQPAGLAPLLGRFGIAYPVDREGRAARWEIAEHHLGRVVFDASNELGARVTAERVGGADNGPCPLEGAVLGCHGPEWNRVRAEPHRFDGAELRCIYSHPQTDGTLTFHFTGLPPARALVGAVGIDDAGWFAAGAVVTAHLTLRLEGQPEMVRDVRAVNRKGVAGYRIDLPHAGGEATMTVTTPDAGARQFCYTFVLTE